MTRTLSLRLGEGMWAEESFSSLQQLHHEECMCHVPPPYYAACYHVGPPCCHHSSNDNVQYGLTCYGIHPCPPFTPFQFGLRILSSVSYSSRQSSFAETHRVHFLQMTSARTYIRVVSCFSLYSTLSAVPETASKPDD